MIFDLSKLKGLIREKNKTQEDIAKMIGISTATFNLKINGNAYFSQDEIFSICEALEIKDSEYKEYFFTLKV